MKLFLLVFSFLSISISPIDTHPDSPYPKKLICKSADVTFQDGDGYTLDVCVMESELKYLPRGFNGAMGDEKAMVISGFPSSFNGRSITIKPKTSLKLIKKGRTSSAFRSRPVIAGKYMIRRGKTTLKLGAPGR